MTAQLFIQWNLWGDTTHGKWSSETGGLSSQVQMYKNVEPCYCKRDLSSEARLSSQWSLAAGFIIFEKFRIIWLFLINHYLSTPWYNTYCSLSYQLAPLVNAPLVFVKSLLLSTFNSYAKAVSSDRWRDSHLHPKQ